MNIITISREFGSGGRELGKRLADLLGYDYYDKEIITAIAKNKGMNDSYVENVLENHGWVNFPMTFRHSFALSQMNIKTDLMLEEKKVIDEIAALGKDFVIVGRSADVLLREYHPFNIFVCADMQSKIRRCMERAGSDEKLTEKELVRKIKEIDKSRIRTREIIGGGAWGHRENYHLTVNTSDWTIKALSGAVKDFYLSFLGRV